MSYRTSTESISDEIGLFVPPSIKYVEKCYYVTRAEFLFNKFPKKNLCIFAKFWKFKRFISVRKLHLLALTENKLLWRVEGSAETSCRFSYHNLRHFQKRLAREKVAGNQNNKYSREHSDKKITSWRKGQKINAMQLYIFLFLFWVILKKILLSSSSIAI